MSYFIKPIRFLRNCFKLSLLSFICLSILSNSCRGGGELSTASSKGVHKSQNHQIGLNEEVNAIDKNGNTTLHLAAMNGHVDVVNTLLKTDDINVNARNKHGNTAFHLAAMNGHVDVVNTLLNHGVDANIEIVYRYYDEDDGKEREWRKAALHLAAKNGHVDVIKTLLNHGININMPSICFICGNEVKYTALHLAALFGHVNVVKELLAHGMNINVGSGIVTPLHLAALFGHIDVVRELLSYEDIDVNNKSSEGYTAFHYAILKMHSLVAQELEPYLTKEDRNISGNVTRYNCIPRLRVKIGEQVYTISKRVRSFFRQQEEKRV